MTIWRENSVCCQCEVCIEVISLCTKSLTTSYKNKSASELQRDAD